VKNERRISGGKAEEKEKFHKNISSPPKKMKPI
jgi:hypothetical protein